MNVRTIVFLVGLVAVSLVAGCATARRGEPLAAAFVSDDSRITRGQRMFYAHCHYCHPHGQGGLGPALNNKPLPGFLIKFQVRHGLGVMPRFNEEKLADADLDSLVAYLKALRGNQPSAR